MQYRKSRKIRGYKCSCQRISCNKIFVETTYRRKFSTLKINYTVEIIVGPNT